MTNPARRSPLPSALAVAFVLVASPWASGQCIVPDNGSGSANLPPVGCAYLTPNGDMRIIDGLPVNTTIEIDAVLGTFTLPMGGGGVCSFAAPSHRQPGGSLGGEQACSDAVLNMPMIGTGTLAGFIRNKNVPIGLEVHTAPRVNGAPVQPFNTVLFRMFGQILGDPDFDLLRVVAGTDFGLPSPGHTTFTQLPGGNWAVDSFFDVTYRIDFVGNPGGPLAGRSGSTTGTVRFTTQTSIGACCNTSTGGCAVVASASCAALGGQVGSPGSVCSLTTCQPLGACCLLTLDCRVVTQATCLAGGNRYLGNGATCTCASGGNVCCPADFNGVGGLTVADIFAFLTAWFAGCP